MCDQKMVCVDIETTGLEWPDSILSVAASYRNGDGGIHSNTWLVTARDLFHEVTPIPQIRSELYPLLANADLITGHNITFDLARLFKHGIVIPDDVRGKLFDTMLIGRMTGPHASHSLEGICGEFKIGTPEWRAMKEQRKVLTKVGVERLIKYNAEDTTNNLLLAEKLWDLGKLIYDPQFMVRESDFCRVTAEMQLLGIGLDADKTLDHIMATRKQRRAIFTQYLWDNRIEGPNNHDDIVNFLRKAGLREFKMTDKGNITLAEDAIDEMIHTLLYSCDPVLDENGLMIDEPVYYDARKKRTKRKVPPLVQNIVDVLDAVLACRGYDKEISTWLEPLVFTHAKEDGRVHANYTVGGAASYRYRCSNPGLQAFPKLDIFEDHETADYSQAEYRIGALVVGYMTGDFSLAEKYAQGFDAHSITAMQIYHTEVVTKAQRDVGKRVNFASAYFSGPRTLARQMGVSEYEAKEFLDMYKNNMHSTFTTSRKVNKKWVEAGYIKLWNGKRIYRKPDDPDYIGWNQWCQGGVAEIAKEAMFNCDAEGIKMLGQVHDSIKYPSDVDKEAAYDCMVRALPDNISSWTNPPIAMKVDGLLNLGG